MEYDKDLQSIQEARFVIEAAKKAQKKLAEMSQEQIDAIVEAMVKKTSENAAYLAKLANEETGFGNVTDKTLKNKFASDVVWSSIKDLKTVGILKDDKDKRIMDVAVPMGVIAGLIPSTNPTSTTIYKALIAVKAGNGIVISPHPGAKNAILETVKILRQAASEAGAPNGIIGALTTLTAKGTEELMKHRDTALILATGGEAMVRAAYSSGNPAIGVGPGNGPAFIERTANVEQAVADIIASKTFDNGVICASEQSIVVERVIAEQVIVELKKHQAYFLSESESDKLAGFILRGNGTMNPQIVGKTAVQVAKMADIIVPENTTILVSPQETVAPSNPYCKEKLCPVIAFYIEENWLDACNRSIELLNVEGRGHTLCIHSQDEEVIKEFALHKPVSRMLINTPGALGGIGGTTNLEPALTLGCGAVGGSSTSDNITPLHLINIRKAAYGVKSMESLRGSEDTAQAAISIGASTVDISDNDVRKLIEAALKKLSETS
ncbi:acetaldehyde dehydrogenase (acetylating) [Enterococcus sp. 669A]|uniref:Acetaldehyde dehydrogenase (Acetylating) n=1 Tax=Candidatus Enterococcus moelleringii TaxID=2815325 RepID=A0ABS3L7P8_9ENTE|nr:acetaldehyde dehydrogenase (acetylating) [Enterococcus sp. 669A]